MKILVLVPGGLVEPLQASPLIASVRAGIPSATVTLACAGPATEIASHIPGVDTVLPIGQLGTHRGVATGFAAWMALRRRRFDAALVCGTSGSARMLAFTAGIPTRVGPGGGFSACCLSAHAAADVYANNAAIWVEMCDALGIDHRRYRPAFDPGPDAHRRARSELERGALDPARRLVALAPGIGADDTLAVDRHAVAWPGERYAHLANHLIRRHGAAVALVGNESDRECADAVAADIDGPVLDLIGRLSLPETAAVLARCELLVGGESPLLHLGAAMGTAVVGLFGPTDGRRRGPYGEDHRVVQGIPVPRRPRRRRRRSSDPEAVPTAMERIRVDDVLAAIEAAL